MINQVIKEKILEIQDKFCGESVETKIYKAIELERERFVEFLEDCIRNTNSVRKKLKIKINELTSCSPEVKK